MKLAYREFGSGTPLIILHGLFGQSDNWNTIAKTFAENGFHVFTVDQRNHGLSDHSNVWTYDSMADDLSEFIKEHALVAPVVVGHSMGGKTAMFFDKKYPGVLSKLVIVDMAARVYPPHHAEIIKALQSVNFNLIRSRKDADEILSQTIQDFGTKQFLLKNIYWKEEGKEMAWRFNLKTISENYDNVGVEVPAYKSDVETLVIKGENSNYVSDADIEEFKHRYQHLRIVSIHGAAHWVHAEKPKEFSETVLLFIKDQAV